MPSSTDIKSFPGSSDSHKLNQPILLSTLANGDKNWEQQVIAKSMDPDNPPILPGWDLRACEEFYNKAVSYGEQGGLIRPPAPILKGAHPVGQATTEALQQMQFDILTYVTTMNPGSSVIKGANGSVGLACTMLQFGVACGRLRGLEQQEWFCAVLAHGEALSGPLGIIYMPRPKVSSGLCDPLRLYCELWM